MTASSSNTWGAMDKARKMIRAAADRHGINLNAYLTSRDLRTATLRACMYRVLREDLHLSYPAIGKAFGGLDHTTIIAGIRRANGEPNAKGNVIDTAAVAREMTFIRGHAAPEVSPDCCPTCGQHVNKDRIVVELREEIQRLEQRINLFAKGSR